MNTLNKTELDRRRLLSCRTEEEWQWWIEDVMLTGGDYRPCLFCMATIEFSWRICEKCIGKQVSNELWDCLALYPVLSDRYIAGWERLRRARIV